MLPLAAVKVIMSADMPENTPFVSDPTWKLA